MGSLPLFLTDSLGRFWAVTINTDGSIQTTLFEASPNTAPVTTPVNNAN